MWRLLRVSLKTIPVLFRIDSHAPVSPSPPTGHQHIHVQRVCHRWLGALHMEAAICLLKLVCHSYLNSLQPFQSVPPQVGTSGRAAITRHTHSYFLPSNPSYFSFICLRPPSCLFIIIHFIEVWSLFTFTQYGLLTIQILIGALMGWARLESFTRPAVLGIFHYKYQRCCRFKQCLCLYRWAKHLWQYLTASWLDWRYSLITNHTVWNFWRGKFIFSQRGSDKETLPSLLNPPVLPPWLLPFCPLLKLSEGGTTGNLSSVFIVPLCCKW